MKRTFIIILLLAGLLPGQACISPEPTRYENTTQQLDVPRAPAGFKKIKIALVNFKETTGRRYIVKPATSQLVSMMTRSGYFDVIEPSLIENIIKTQADISPEKLRIIQDKFGAEYFLTGTLTNFEISERGGGFCLFPIAGKSTKEYNVEIGVDYRLVTVPDAKIKQADLVEHKRIDTSSSTHALIFTSGNSVRVLESSSGKLLRYAMRDMLAKIVSEL